MYPWTVAYTRSLNIIFEHVRSSNLLERFIYYTYNAVMISNERETIAPSVD